MRYLPYAAASSEPNVIVDGTANDRTLITLSHWRQSGTPAELMADTSTAIVFNYLDRPDLHAEASQIQKEVWRLICICPFEPLGTVWIM